MEYSSDSKNSGITVVAEDDPYKTELDDQLILLAQAELNDLIQDMKLSKM